VLDWIERDWPKMLQRVGGGGRNVKRERVGVSVCQWMPWPLALSASFLQTFADPNRTRSDAYIRKHATLVCSSEVAYSLRHGVTLLTMPSKRWLLHLLAALTSR
jgi:hypothetical protein